MGLLRLRWNVKRLRRWLRSRFRTTFEVDELPSNGFWSLRFPQPETEVGFLLSRQQGLVTGTCRCASLIFCHIFLAWSITGFAWRTSSFSFTEVMDDRMHPAPMIRNAVLILTLTLAGLTISLLRVPAFARCVGPRVLDQGVACLLWVCVILVFLQSPWYLIRLFDSVDPEAALRHPITEDLYLMLSLDCVLTATHLAIPVRWFLLVPMQLTVALGYPLLGLLVGSNQHVSTVGLNVVMLGALTFAASLGRRHSEIQERVSFMRIVQERSLRVQAEFKLTTSQRSSEAPRIEVDQRSCPTSVPTTNCTGVMFQGFQSADAETVFRKVAEIAEIGKREHWLIDPSDVKAESKALGAGGFGVVLEARYHGARVAIKASLAAEEMSWDIVAMANELRMLRRLRHPNIVLFYGACIIPDTADLVLVMECVQGVRLDHYVRPPPSGPSEEVRWKLADDVCCALLYMHSQTPRIVHGDIKDNNMMVETGAVVNVKLLDFGLSRLMTKQARPGGGTASWQAPECFDRAKAPATSSDVFSCGRLLYKLATGLRPYETLSDQIVLNAMREKLDLRLDWREVPAGSGFRVAAERCCALVPAARPTIAELRELCRSFARSAALAADPAPAAGKEPALAEVLRDCRSLLRQNRSSGGGGAQGVPSTGPQSGSCQQLDLTLPSLTSLDFETDATATALLHAGSQSRGPELEPPGPLEPLEPLEPPSAAPPAPGAARDEAARRVPVVACL